MHTFHGILQKICKLFLPLQECTLKFLPTPHLTFKSNRFLLQGGKSRIGLHVVTRPGNDGILSWADHRMRTADLLKGMSVGVARKTTNWIGT